MLAILEKYFMGEEVVKRDYSFLYGATINVLTFDFFVFRQSRRG